MRKEADYGLLHRAVVADADGRRRRHSRLAVEHMRGGPRAVAGALHGRPQGGDLSLRPRATAQLRTRRGQGGRGLVGMQMSRNDLA